MKPRDWAAKALSSRIFQPKVMPNKKRAIKQGYNKHKGNQQ